MSTEIGPRTTRRPRRSAAEPRRPAARSRRPAAEPRRPTSRRGRIRRFLPPQHGAWAMLLLPYLAGVLAVGWSWPHLPLLGAWLAGYLCSYYLFQAVKSRRIGRFADQLLAYGPVTAMLGVVVAVARPAVLWYAPAFAVLVAVNVWYAARRRERAIGNDLASVVQSCLMVPVTATVAGVPAERVGPVFGAVLLYFVGTVLYVKTMIRERGHAGYRHASVAYHGVALVVAAWLDPLLAGLFALLLSRAWVLPAQRLAPRQVGVLEIVACVLLLAVTLAL
ncbi:YwiC-like family protein [Plantactinospora sp. GCM10030261]|uniref:YwiC-like family protein n=1 Tax=Plantactinospora sp. GCM10030261 TaxID=3273420 RepID=UPI00360EC0A7